MNNIMRYLRKRGRFFLPYLLILVMALIILEPQLRAHAFFPNSDVYFHMNRFYDAMMQIKTGHFSYFLSFYGFNRVARISNALYGPLWAYLNGLILLIIHNWYRWEIFESFLILVIGGISMYIMSKGLGDGRLFSVMLSVIYMMSYNLSLWLLHQEFTGVGAAFLPLFILLGYQMIKTRRIKVLKTALLMTLLAQIHLLTTLITCVVLIPFFIVASLRSNQRGTLIRQLCEAVALTLALTVNIWGSVIEIIQSNRPRFVPPFPVFNFKTLYYSLSWDSASKAFNLLSPAFTVIILVIAVWFVFNFSNWDLSTKLMGIMAGFLFWASSVWFPWRIIQARFPLIDSSFQQPRRLLPFSIVLIFAVVSKLLARFKFKSVYHTNSKLIYVVMLMCLLIVAGIALKSSRDNIGNQIADYNSSSVVSFGYFKHYNQKNPQIIRDDYHRHNLKLSLNNVVKANTDYLPTRYKLNNLRNYYKFYPYHFSLHYLAMYKFARARRTVLPHAAYQMTFHYHHSRHLLLPLVKYSHTKVWVNHHVFRPRRRQIFLVGNLIIPTKQGLNTVKVQYQPAKYYRWAVELSILVWILTIGYLVRSVIKLKS